MKSFLLILCTVFSVSPYLYAQTVDTPVTRSIFLERVVDFALTNKGQTIALPELYDALITEAAIPDDGDERLLLVQILKQKGFTVTDWGRGNMPDGPRIVSLTLVKEHCSCRVDKKYAASLVSGYLQRSEQISCTDMPAKHPETVNGNLK